MTASAAGASQRRSEDPAADDWLIGKAQTGDVEAYESLVRRHRQRAYRIALRIVGNPEDAQDVTQDVFIQIWSSLAGFLGGSTFTTWLYRIVVNRSLNHRQRSKEMDALPDDRLLPAVSGSEETVIARHRAAATAAAISALPDDQRAVFVLHQMEGLSYQEVAAILDVPEATIRGRLARGRRTLVEQLREWS